MWGLLDERQPGFSPKANWSGCFSAVSFDYGKVSTFSWSGVAAAFILQRPGGVVDSFVASLLWTLLSEQECLGVSCAAYDAFDTTHGKITRPWVMILFSSVLKSVTASLGTV